MGSRSGQRFLTFKLEGKADLPHISRAIPGIMDRLWGLSAELNGCWGNSWSGFYDRSQARFDEPAKGGQIQSHGRLCSCNLSWTWFLSIRLSRKLSYFFFTFELNRASVTHNPLVVATHTVKLQQLYYFSEHCQGWGVLTCFIHPFCWGDSGKFQGSCGYNVANHHRGVYVCVNDWM